MAKQKLYTSKAWLERQVYTNRKTPEQIAAEQGVTKKTIYNHLNKYGVRY